MNMKIFLLAFLAISSSLNASTNPEYQQMLDARAAILGLPKSKNLPEVSQSLPKLIQEEEALNNQFTDLLQQLKNLETLA